MRQRKWTVLLLFNQEGARPFCLIEHPRCFSKCIFYENNEKQSKPIVLNTPLRSIQVKKSSTVFMNTVELFFCNIYRSFYIPTQLKELISDYTFNIFIHYISWFSLGWELKCRTRKSQNGLNVEIQNYHFIYCRVFPVKRQRKKCDFK